jgi:hypothetical protein
LTRHLEANTMGETRRESQESFVKKNTFASLALGIVLVAAFGVACKNGSATLSLEEYFRKVDDIQNTGYSAYATQEAAKGTPSDSASGKELAAFQRESWTITAAAQHDYAKQLGDIDPPDEVAGARNGLVDALNAAGDALDNAANSLPASITMADLQNGGPTGEELTTTSNNLIAACHALQQIANDNDITVDLGCA